MKVLTGETRKLTKASAAIAAQRPEEIEVSGAKVREFAETLRAMQTMGSQLTASLQSQWKGTAARRADRRPGWSMT